MKSGIMIVIGLVIVGGIGVFSIYIQADDAVLQIKNIVEPNFHCLADYDYVFDKLEADPQAKFIEKVQEIGRKLLRDGCYDTFREWMPESHPGWDQMIVKENNRISTCENYLAGEGMFTELDIQSLRLWECKDFLKK